MRIQTSLAAVSASAALLLGTALGTSRLHRPAAAAPALATERPAGRVILISIDTLRQDHLGLYGYPRPTSPELDRFARAAAVFDDAMAQAPYTLPSHMSMMTGLQPGAHRVRVMTDVLDPCHVTIAEVLRDAGYRTAAFTDGGFMRARFGFDHGFEQYDDAREKGHADVNGFRRFGTKVQDWIRDHQDEPFFLFVHTFDTHGPYVAEERCRDALAGTAPVVPAGAAGEPDAMAYLREVACHDYLELDRYDSLADLIDDYDAAIRFVDEQVGELFRHLESLDLFDDALIIVTSDHGESFLDHRLYVGHGLTLQEEEVRVPLIVKFPGGRHAGARVTDVVRLIDLFPTIAAVAGVEPPRSQGADLRSAIEGRDPEPRIAAGESPNLAVGDGLSPQDVSRYLRGRDLKYVEAPAIPWNQLVSRHLLRSDAEDVEPYDLDADPLGFRARIPSQARLFDLAADRGETRDLSSARPRDREGMRRRLETAFAEDAGLRCASGEEASFIALTPEEIDRLIQLGYLSLKQGEQLKQRLRDAAGEDGEGSR